MKILPVGILLLLAACSNEPAAQRKQATPAVTPSAEKPQQIAGAPPASPVKPPAAKGRFAPRDECASAPGAAEFRRALANAVRMRDVSAMAGLADPAIKLDFGGGSGLATLRERLAGDGGKQLWAELDSILALGCALQHGNLVLPWLFAQDLGGIDPYSAMIVTGIDVPVRASASHNGKAIAKLSWAAVELVGGLLPDAAFQHIRVPGGPAGYIATSALRSPLDYRIIADRKNGEWKIGAFIAGD